MPQVQYYPVLNPLGFYDIVQIVEDDAPPTPILPFIPLPDIIEAHNDWLPWNNGVQVNADRRYGLLTPPKTPLPLHLEDIQEYQFQFEPVPDMFDYVPDDQNVLETPNTYIWMEEGPADEVIFGPLEPMVIDDDAAQEPGPVGFDVYEMNQEFYAIFDEDEDGEEGEDDTDEEVCPRSLSAILPTLS